MPDRPYPDPTLPLTTVLRRALAGLRDHTAQSDMLFLERWEIAPQPGTALALRVQQIRRGNPELADAIRSEIAGLRAAPPRLA